MAKIETVYSFIVQRYFKKRIGGMELDISITIKDIAKKPRIMPAAVSALTIIEENGVAMGGLKSERNQIGKIY